MDSMSYVKDNTSLGMKLNFYNTYCTPYEIVSCYDNLKDGL